MKLRALLFFLVCASFPNAHADNQKPNDATASSDKNFQQPALGEHPEHPIHLRRRPINDWGGSLGETNSR